ncbi:MAG: M28 family peptidase [Nitrolancea sp.]
MSAKHGPELESTLMNAVSTDELMNSTRSIAQWVRLSGTDEEAKSFDWIEGKLEEYGLEVNRYAHPALVSWPESASLELLSNGGSESIHCATHAFATSTPEGGIEGELVPVGPATAENLRGRDLRGKIVLIDGIISPNSNQLVEQAGVAAAIWIAGERLHERGLDPIWGTPTPETSHLLPKTPSVSVRGVEGTKIKEALARGSVRVKLQTRVYQDWRTLPLLTGDLRTSTDSPGSDLFVMFSGHVDSWYYGAMDNGTANATMLEVARILAQHRDSLRRGLRVCFWSGHSHARYAGSAWYADNFWHDLHDHCVAHVNVDSVGGIGATVLSQGNTMSEVRDFVSDIIEQVAGQELARRRYGRSGDQSFWGHGIPAMLMSLSEQPAENADPLLLALHHQISGGGGAGGGLGWWWHTPDDLVDKIDPDYLKRDATIYTLILSRLCSTPILPYRYAEVVVDLRAVTNGIQEKAGTNFDLAPVAEQIETLAKAIDELDRRVSALGEDTSDEQRAALNRGLMQIGRALIPVDYTRTGQFDHDLAVPTQPLPALQPAVLLAGMDANGADYQFLRTRLVRERNRVVYGLKQAIKAADETRDALSQS